MRPAGSSPLTRGKQALGGVQDAQGGLIPAHAGKTAISVSLPDQIGAHPRSRGENRIIGLTFRLSLGSSPLTRGKHSRHAGERHARGLIPAHAGKTTELTIGAINPGAHPRSRGENAGAACTGTPTEGSSPLTRGKPQQAALAVGTLGLIPAHAGKTQR